MKTLFIKHLRIIMMIALTILISFHFLRISLLDTIEAEIIQGVKPELSIDAKIAKESDVFDSTSRKILFLKSKNFDGNLMTRSLFVIQKNLPVATPFGYGKDSRGSVYSYSYMKKSIYLLLSDAKIMVSADNNELTTIEIELNRTWFEILCWIILIVVFWKYCRIEYDKSSE